VNFLLYTLGDERTLLHSLDTAGGLRAAERRVLHDLSLALPGAILVCFLPGWFWARLLNTSADRAEQVAYSVALAITLVPAAALVQARLLDTGVTLAVAVASPLVVFLAGLVAYLRFGPAKGPDEPIAPPPPPPRMPALVLLAVAFALALVAFFDMIPVGWLVILVAPLVFIAGILHLLAYPRSEASERRSTVTSGVHPWVRYAVLSVVLLPVLLRGYLGPLVHGWPYPRGVDRYEHAVMTSMTLSGGSTESFMLYPPGFHFLAAEISRLTGLEPLAVFPALAPAMLLLPALGCYAIANRLWGWECGVAAALFSGLVIGGPYLHFAEARYPNFLGTQFLIVLALAALIGIYAPPPSVRGGLLFAVLGSSTVLYHQIASYSLAVLLGFVGLLSLPYLLVRDRRKGVALFLSLALLGFLSVIYAWDTYDLPRLVAGLLEQDRTGRGGEAVAMAIGTKTPYDLGHLLATTSEPVAWLGLLGVILVAGELLRRRVEAPAALAYLTIVLWALLLFVGSRTSLSGFPDRFERDFGIPLAILAALALVTVLRSLRSRRRIALLAAPVLVVLLAGALVGGQAVRNLEQAAGPSPRLKDRPPPAAVAAAGAWLKEHNTGGNIIATPYLNYVPSRGMLAMGGYAGMQSYDAARIRRDRDLPPFGAGPLWDALWVLKNPGSERTDRIMAKNDVRYVVFHKRYPGANWRNFERRKGLYRVVFENEGVVIFEPRESWRR
jgi:hypothetical protein